MSVVAIVVAVVVVTLCRVATALDRVPSGRWIPARTSRTENHSRSSSRSNRFDGISLQPDDDESMPHKPCFCAPFEREPDSLIDRLAWVMEQYTGPASRMALVGMGGSGKSQVAIQVAQYTRETSLQTSVFWVHARLCR
ncbi:hypothetical protein B0T10DRAFT_564963 [Thelonectria olida]|uniref:Uncharacterized protein n=1 Tax=Thelonectria olida TaxID=1576542 RepID=A0A9P9AIF9_9HYPO|nr:hypothetical protein B0T10DRAFT_564963 [Thelonectria olida]